MPLLPWAQRNCHESEPLHIFGRSRATKQTRTELARWRRFPGNHLEAKRGATAVARMLPAWDGGGLISLEFLDTCRKGLSNRLRQLRFAAVSSICDGQLENLP